MMVGMVDPSNAGATLPKPLASAQRAAEFHNTVASLVAGYGAQLAAVAQEADARLRMLESAMGVVGKPDALRERSPTAEVPRDGEPRGDQRRDGGALGQRVQGKEAAREEGRQERQAQEVGERAVKELATFLRDAFRNGWKNFSDEDAYEAVAREVLRQFPLLF